MSRWPGEWGPGIKPGPVEAAELTADLGMNWDIICYLIDAWPMANFFVSVLEEWGDVIGSKVLKYV
jgi:hypothetical protein